MKTILRNLFYTLKRFRTASVLNLLGLSTAFAAFILIMMKASYEISLITLITITVQNYRTAISNPTDNLKAE